MAPPKYKPAPACRNCKVFSGEDIPDYFCNRHGLSVVPDYICDDYTPDEYHEEIQRAPNLISISTCDLVAELATREGVTEYVAGVQDRYLVRVKTDEGVSRVDFDLGPAVILVVVD
jgi:hypothetical protein